MLRIEHLTKMYGTKKAVDVLSLHAAPGEFAASSSLRDGRTLLAAGSRRGSARHAVTVVMAGDKSVHWCAAHA